MCLHQKKLSPSFLLRISQAQKGRHSMMLTPLSRGVEQRSQGCQLCLSLLCPLGQLMHLSEPQFTSHKSVKQCHLVLYLSHQERLWVPGLTHVSD